MIMQSSNSKAGLSSSKMSATPNTRIIVKLPFPRPDVPLEDPTKVRFSRISIRNCLRPMVWSSSDRLDRRQGQYIVGGDCKG